MPRLKAKTTEGIKKILQVSCAEQTKKEEQARIVNQREEKVKVSQ